MSNTWYKVYQRAFNHVETPITRVLAYPDYAQVFESYTETSSNELGTVTTRGYSRLRSLRPSRWNLLWSWYSAIKYLSTGAINRYRSIHYSTSTGLLHYLVGTLWHAIQLQCHQIELLTIVETHKFKRDTKGPTYKCLLTTNIKISYEIFYA